MIVEQSLVIVAEIEGIPSNLDSLGQVAEGQVEHVDLVVPRLVVEHDVELLAFVVHLVLALLLLYQVYLLFLVTIDDQLDFLIQLNDWLRDLSADFRQENRSDDHEAESQ